MSGTSLATWWWRQMATWARLFRRDDVALGYWRRIHAARPEDPRVLASVAHLAAQRGATGEAIALLDQAVTRDPSDAPSWFNLGFLRQKNGDHDGALAAFGRAVSLDPKLDRAWYGQGISLMQAGRLQEAIEPLTRNTRLQPMSPFGWYQLGHVHARLGQRAEAEKMVRRLAQFEPQVARQLAREIGLPVTPASGADASRTHAP